jgi:hypothetical protein
MRLLPETTAGAKVVESIKALFLIGDFGNLARVKIRKGGTRRRGEPRPRQFRECAGVEASDGRAYITDGTHALRSRPARPVRAL